MENYLNKNECMSAFPVCITTLFIRPSRDFSRGGEGFSRKKFSREGGGEVSTRGVFWGDILGERVLSVGKFTGGKFHWKGGFPRDKPCIFCLVVVQIKNPTVAMKYLFSGKNYNI